MFSASNLGRDSTLQPALYPTANQAGFPFTSRHPGPHYPGNPGGDKPHVFLNGTVLMPNSRTPMMGGTLYSAPYPGVRPME